MTEALGLGRYLHTDWTSIKVAGWIKQLARDRPLPEYGSWAWVGAEAGPAVASALAAAEARRLDLLYRDQALHDEMAAARRLQDEADMRAFADLAGRVTGFDYLARRAAGLAKEPSHAELLERRAS